MQPGSHQRPIAQFGVVSTSALAVVGLNPGDLLDAAAGQMSGGHAYVVGSLASGVGNPASDVDIHILRPDLTAAVGPFMHFINGVVVDIECYPAATSTHIRDVAATITAADSPLGPFALERPTDPVFGSRIVPRWLHATPLAESSPPIFDREAECLILPILVRDAFEDLVRFVALARLANAAGEDPTACRYLWRQASHMLLELRCRVAGDVTTNAKWLPARAARLGLYDRTSAIDESDYRRAASRASVPSLDEWDVVRLRPGAGRRPVRIADRTWALTKHGRLLSSWCDQEGTVSEMVDRTGAAGLLTALRTADLEMDLDGNKIRKAVTA
jgi:hypothetical protein